MSGNAISASGLRVFLFVTGDRGDVLCARAGNSELPGCVTDAVPAGGAVGTRRRPGRVVHRLAQCCFMPMHVLNAASSFRKRKRSALKIT